MILTNTLTRKNNQILHDSTVQLRATKDYAIMLWEFLQPLQKKKIQHVCALFLAIALSYGDPLSGNCSESELSVKSKTPSLFAELASGRHLIKAKMTIAKSPNGLWSQLIDPDHPLWQEAAPWTIVLRRWTVAGGKMQRHSLPVCVQGYHNEHGLILRLSWTDPSHDTTLAGESFPDACAIELPLSVNSKTPCAAMGQAGGPVNIWRWSGDEYEGGAKAKEHISRCLVGSGQLENLLAEGPSTLTPSKSSNLRLAAGSCWREGRWAITILREPSSDTKEGRPTNAGTIPMAFAVWDGSHSDRAGQKFVSSWIYVQLN